MRISDWSSDVCSSDLDAVFGKGVADLGVDFARRGEVVADRLFHRDAAFGAGDVRGPQALRDRAEHRRRGREVNPDRTAQTVAEQRRELVITGARTRIDRAIVDAFEEAFDTGFVDQVGGKMLGERALNLNLKSGAVHLRAPR